MQQWYLVYAKKKKKKKKKKKNKKKKKSHRNTYTCRLMTSQRDAAPAAPQHVARG
jgi:hypothetical protein